MKVNSVITRRDFIRITTNTGGALVFGVFLGKIPLLASAHTKAGSLSPDAFLSIDENSFVTVVIPVPEIGQGVRTALSMLIAEELEADWTKVKVKQADAGEQYGAWPLAAGSFSIKSYWKPLRRTGAVARELLIDAAAQNWGVEKGNCTAKNSHVWHIQSGRKYSFGHLVGKASSLPITESLSLKNPADFRLIGTRVPNIDGPAIIDGSIRFGMDEKAPEMLYASIERCPVFGGKAVSYNYSAAMEVSGVRDVLKIDPQKPYVEGGVAVIGESTWAAIKGRKALNVEWDEGVNKDENTLEYIQKCKAILNEPAFKIRNDGHVENALKDAVKVLDAVYETPHLAHTPMEPMNCTAFMQSDRCEIWAPAQIPMDVRRYVAETTGLPQQSVTVHIRRCGGGFGRRLRTDFALEAVILSKSLQVPVKVVWTREDDLRHDFYRPMGIHLMKAGIDSEGQIVSWLHRRVGDSRNPSRARKHAQVTELYVDGFPAGLIENFSAEHTAVSTGIRRGDWRAPGHNANAFVIECFIDEIALQLVRDPLEFRLGLLGKSRDLPYKDHGGPAINTGRMKGVLKLVAEKAHWGKKMPHGRSQGIAAHFTFGTYVAEVAEVSVSKSGKLTVHRIVAAVDCGTVVNRSGAEAQIEGAVMDGLSAVRYGEITVAQGRVQQSNFHDYPMMRINEAPVVDVHFVDSIDLPSGLGEMGLPPVAPAVCNAIFKATGMRVRKLPLSKTKLVS